MGNTAETAVGKHLMPITTYQVVAPHYDHSPNPLLALEERMLLGCLPRVDGRRVLDAGCGTGRWMERLVASGASAFGLDLSDRMLIAAARRPTLAGRLAVADLQRLPIPNNAFHLALCSFALSYAPALTRALAELARVARQVIVTDLHPEAMQSGWKRAFGKLEVPYTPHTIEQLDSAANDAGLTLTCRREAAFGEPERVIFQAAGKASDFARMSGHPAILISSWSQHA